MDNPDISLTSPYGNDSFIFFGIANGISMEPTIKNGAVMVFNKTHDIHEGDIVSAEYSNPGDIIKRVGEIRGSRVYLISDNVNGSYVKNGRTVEYEGLRTWVDMSDIQGVLIDVVDNGSDVIML